MLFFAAEGPFIFQVFENNLINWLALVALIIWMTIKFVPNILTSRKEHISASINAAALEKKEAENFLEQQKKRVANAEHDAQNILTEAKQMAQKLHNESVAQTKKEMTDLQHKIELSLENERRQAITQMRAIAGKAAIRLTEEAVPSAITSSVKTRLMSQFLEQLEATKNA